MLEMYGAIWRLTMRRQILLILLSLLLAGLAAAPLELQKDIINHIVAGGGHEMLGWLCLGFVAVTAVSAAVKLVTQYVSSALGESVIRDIRKRVYARLVGARDRTDGPGTGTSVTMISSEAEQLGAFAGDAITLPLVQFGTLATVLIYISAQSWVLGAITAAVVIPQGLIALLTQQPINARVRRRVAALREGTDRVAASDLAAIDPEVDRTFGTIYEARCGIFRIKLSTKFVMNVINGFGAAAILWLGGQAVIDGRIDVGVVTVALTGLAKAVDPWRQLVTFYRRTSMVLVRFQILRETFPLETTR